MTRNRTGRRRPRPDRRPREQRRRLPTRGQGPSCTAPRSSGRRLLRAEPPPRADRHVPRTCCRAMVEQWARRDRQQLDGGGVPRHPRCTRRTPAFNAGGGRRSPRSLAVDVGATRRSASTRSRPTWPTAPQTPGRELMLRGRDPDLMQDLDPGRAGSAGPTTTRPSSSSWHPTTRGSSPGRRSRWTAARWPLPGWYARADGKGWTNMPNEA